MKKTLLIIIIAFVVLGAGAFYGGLKYGQGRSGSGNFQQFGNLSPDERQQRFGQMDAANPAGMAAIRTGGRAGGNFAAGEIIAKDGQSVTVKLQDGGSKIVFYSDSTAVSRTVDATAADLEIGQTTTISGAANDDGSLTAKDIQIAPSLPTAPTVPTPAPAEE